jgi:hypothetical protein
MTNARNVVLFAMSSLAVACAQTAPVPTQPTSASMDTALSKEKTNAALASTPESGTDCRTFAVVAAPIAAKHLEDPNIQQTVGRTQLVSYGKTGEKVLEGATVATVVGKQPSGELLGNHILAFPEGTIRSQNDVISLAPTADKCVFNAKVKMIYADGSGEFAGLSGSGNAEAMLNFCGGVGRGTIYGRLCKGVGK